MMYPNTFCIFKDNPEGYKMKDKTGIREIFVCDFDYENLKSPCHYKACQKDDEDLRCVRYALDYCHEFRDRGCIVQLPQLLNKVGRKEYGIIQEMTSDYS